MVAGVGYGPVIRPGRLPVLEVGDRDPAESPTRARRSGPRRSRGSRKQQRPSPTGCATGRSTPPVRRPRCWPPTPRSPRDRGMARRGRGEADRRRHVRAARDRRPRSTQFVDMFTQIGGLMAERVTDLQRHPRPRHRRAHRPARAGRAAARRSRRSWCAEDLAPADTAGLDPDADRRPGDHARRADQPHRDHRPPARDPVRGRGRGSRATLPAGHASSSSTAPTGTVELSTRTRRAAGGGRRGAASERGADSTAWTGPGATADGTRVEVLANVQDGAGGARRRVGRRPRASGCSAPSCASSTADAEPTVEEQAGDLRRGAGGVRRAARSSCARSTPGRTSR